MEYDYERLLADIIEAVSGSSSIQSRMVQLIDACEAQVPHQQWADLRRLDFETDRASLPTWLNRDAAPSGPQGLWFGLFNAYRGDVEVLDVYVGLSAEFADGSIDWAMKVEATRELNSVVLSQIYAVAYQDDDSLENLAEYPLGLAYGAIIAIEAINVCKLAQSMPTLRGAALGFDSGDGLRLGRFGSEGFGIAPSAY